MNIESIIIGYLDFKNNDNFISTHSNLGGAGITKLVRAFGSCVGRGRYDLIKLKEEMIKELDLWILYENKECLEKK